MARRKKIWGLIGDIWRGYWRDECLILSAAISYYAIFSIIPFLFLLFVIWGFLVGSSEMLYGEIVQFANALFPEIRPEILEDIRSVVEHRSALGWVGVGFLVWIFDVVFYSIAHAFDRIFGSGGRRKYYQMKLFSFAVLLLAGFTVYTSIHLAFLATAIRNTGVTILGIHLSEYLAKSFSFRTGIFVVLVGVFTAMFRIVPRVPVRLSDAFLGGLLCAVLWTLARYAFHWYVENIAVFNIVYGTLGTLVVLVLWIFYSANIVLICAEFVSALNRGGEESPPEGKRPQV